MPAPIQFSGDHVDLSPRVYQSAAVTASPAAASETAICTVTCTGDIAAMLGVILVGWYSVTIGTSGALLTTKLRRTSAAGATVIAGGTETVTATQVYTRAIVGFDTGPTLPGQVYVLTLTVGSGAAASTVSATQLVAMVI